MASEFQSNWAKTEWPVIKQSILQKFHSDDARIFMLPELEVVFVGRLSDDKYPPLSAMLREKGWIGISHQVGSRLREMIDKGLFQNHLDNCLGVITLSEYAREEWRKLFPDVRTAILKHPFPRRKLKFRPNDLKGIRSLGKWRRKYDIWEALDSPYPKIDGVNINILPVRDFIQQFGFNLQFMDVVDASANNGVLECIRRNTPLLVNRHPAVVEYLGEDYPFYFESLDEANEKINNPQLIIKTHRYLKNMDKADLDFENFEEGIVRILNEWGCG